MPRQFNFSRPVILTGGIASLVFGVFLLGLALWEAFGGAARGMQVVELPGFHELTLDKPGLYAGVYQHRGTGPIPSAALSKMDVRVFAKDSYAEVPVLMNSTGQVFRRMGVVGMPLFNFAVEEPGVYTLSGVYGGGADGPTVPVYIVSQAVQNVKPLLFVGGTVCALFIALGVWILRRLNEWAPPEATRR